MSQKKSSKFTDRLFVAFMAKAPALSPMSRYCCFTHWCFQPYLLKHVLVWNDEQLYFTVALVSSRGTDEPKEVFKVH